MGIQNGEDSGVCLMQDGRILEAVSEERFSRVKLQNGFPGLSLDYVLAAHGLDIRDIDCFAYGWHGDHRTCPDYPRRVTERILDAVAADPRAAAMIRRRAINEVERDEALRREFAREMTARAVPDDRILNVDHHLSHSWAAFACSPFERAMTFTFDGRGGVKSSIAAIAAADEGHRELDYHLSVDSLGFLYGQITHFLGFTPHRHEGKVTGLAAYGDAEKTLPIFRDLIGWHDGRFVANLGYYKPFYSKIDPDLHQRYASVSREDLAAGLQAHCEDLAARYVSYWIDVAADGGPVDVCLAGGVTANVRINQRVAELPGVRSLFVFPHMGDGGLPVGSAAYAHFLMTGEAKVDFPTVHLGPAFSDQAIARCLGDYGGRVRVRQLADRVGEVVSALAAGRVVGYVDGRMEYGPRALGARSILYHTRDRTVNDWLNKRLRRTEFMPFAPVTPAEYAGDCYEGWAPDHVCAHFMTRTYRCTDAFAAGHPAVVHVDGTARPQVVRPDLNGDYFEVVRGYCERTGERALINTSFNVHEEPIVCSPEDAIESLLLDTVDVLVIGGYAVEKA